MKNINKDSIKIKLKSYIYSDLIIRTPPKLFSSIPDCFSDSQHSVLPIKAKRGFTQHPIRTTSGGHTLLLRTPRRTWTPFIARHCRFTKNDIFQSRMKSKMIEERRAEEEIHHTNSENPIPQLGHNTLWFLNIAHHITVQLFFQPQLLFKLTRIRSQLPHHLIFNAVSHNLTGWTQLMHINVFGYAIDTFLKPGTNLTH